MNRLIIALALGGWALLGYAVLPSPPSHPDARAEIDRLRQVVEKTSAERDTLADKLAQLNRKKEDLQHLQRQITAATQEIKHLEYIRARVSGEIDSASAKRQSVEAAGQAAVEGGLQAQASETRPSKPPSQALPRDGDPPPNVGTTSSPATAASPPSKEKVRAAQEALTALGYGQLKADGVFGPSTRRAIEAFEQAKGLPITGSLGAGTLQALEVGRSSAIR
jgi:chromosome segregation ATPase